MPALPVWGGISIPSQPVNVEALRAKMPASRRRSQVCFRHRSPSPNPNRSREPDLNDGVRMNIRPFVEAGALRKNPRVKWTKERVNDVHLSNTEKREARERAPQERSAVQ